MLPSDADSAKRQLTLEALAAHGHCRLQVSGTSMLPTLWPGDMVRIEARQTLIEVGEIVLFERADRLFLHRVERLTTIDSVRGLITRGDAVPQPDPQVSVSCVKGVLTGVLRGRAWVSVARRVSPMSRLLASLLGRSGFFVRWTVRVRNRARSMTTSAVAFEVPTS